MNLNPSAPPRRLVATSPDWHLSGVNVFVARLCRELGTMGWETTLVLTNPERDSREIAAVPSDLRVVRFADSPNRAWRARQAALREELAQQGPCVFLPNYDFDTAGVLPTLPREVVTVGVLHSDEDIYYRFIGDLGPWMDAVVAVSERIETETRAQAPGCAARLSRIPYGVPTRAAPPPKPAAAPLRVLYAGRISTAQKRILDLGTIAAAAHAQKLPVEFDIAGDGAEMAALRERAVDAVAAGTVRLHGALPPERVRELADRAHVLMLTSEFEGLPVVLLEAMEAGCVPVVTDIRSGIGELVRHGETGLLFPVGETTAGVAALQSLAADPARLARLAAAAHARFSASDYSLPTVARRYARLFDEAWARRARGDFAPAAGRAFAPRHHRLSSRVFTRLRQLLRAKP